MAQECDPPSLARRSSHIRLVLVEIMDDYDARLKDLGDVGRAGRPNRFVHRAWFTEPLYQALRDRIHHQNTASLDDAAELRAWLTAGAGLRLDSLGFDVLAEPRAEWIGRLDQLEAPPAESTGQRIRRRREELRLSQGRLGLRVGVTAETVSRWERGVQPIRARYRLGLSQALGGRPSDYEEE